MLKHTLLVIFRNFKRHKATFFINLVGLSTGLACALLIYLWVQDEQGFDKFHAQGDQIFRVMANHKHTDVTNTVPDVPGLLAPALKAEFPEIEKAVSTSSGGVKGAQLMTVSTEDKHFKASGRFASQDFFSIFSYELLTGQKDQVLTDKNAVVISESLAKRLFGTTENVIGKSLEWELSGSQGKVAVSGVFRDVPANSSEVFDFVLSFDYYEKELYGKYAHWHNYYAYSYLMLKKGTDVAAFNAKILNFMKTKAEDSNITLFVEPFSENYLHGKYVNGQKAGGRIEYVRLFSLIALFLLAIACINFMNLSTAKSAGRGKEVGIKKAVGAGRGTLVSQFLGESMLMAFGSLAVAILWVKLLLPQFNRIMDKQISLHFDADFLVPMLGITLLTGLIAGSYPAFYLSNFNPVGILKGKIKASLGELWVRKGLVVFQFGISLVLIVGVLIIYRQIEFVQNKNLGFDQSNLLQFEIQGKVGENREAFFSEIRQIPGVISAASSSFRLGKGNWTQGIQWEGKAPDADFTFFQVFADAGALDALGLQMAEGRGFSKQFGTDKTGIIFNESAIKIMGLKDPVGKVVHHYNGDKQIVGVVKDFHFTSLHGAIMPLFFLYEPEKTTQALVKIAAGKERETIEQLKVFYEKFNPGYAFDFTFLDQDYQALYESEQRVSLLSRYFAGLAILISCLGLFGLATYTAEQRRKEIGIRKVLGASVAGITRLLAKDFLKLVLAAIVVASPVAYFFMQKWLADFAYRIDIQWWMFAGAGAV
ncbi:MAG TPA: ABC transporter permease, partial [Saprospiraceae bacterium]|nr:ABC transporter permease [Saprospiraceae bacterium]